MERLHQPEETGSVLGKRLSLRQTLVLITSVKEPGLIRCTVRCFSGLPQLMILRKSVPGVFLRLAEVPEFTAYMAYPLD